MGIRFGLRWQIALVVALFIASVAILLSSSLAVFWMPAREVHTQNELIEAIGRMTAEAAPLLNELPEPSPRKPPPDWPARLTDATSRALADCPGVEGGFYLAGNWDKFVGHAFPGNPHAPPEPPPPPGKKHPHKLKKGPGSLPPCPRAASWDTSALRRPTIGRGRRGSWRWV